MAVAVYYMIQPVLREPSVETVRADRAGHYITKRVPPARDLSALARAERSAVVSPLDLLVPTLRLVYPSLSISGIRLCLSSSRISLHPRNVLSVPLESVLLCSLIVLSDTHPRILLISL